MPTEGAAASRRAAATGAGASSAGRRGAAAAAADPAYSPAWAPRFRARCPPNRPPAFLVRECFFFPFFGRSYRTVCLFFYVLFPVLGGAIGILIWIRIRIWMRGSMSLTNGSGSCYFLHWSSRCRQKLTKKGFLLISFWRYIFIIFQRWKKSKRSHKAVGIKVLLLFLLGASLPILTYFYSTLLPTQCCGSGYDESVIYLHPESRSGSLLFFTI